MSQQEIAISKPLEGSIHQSGEAQAQPSSAFLESYHLGQFPGKGNKAQWDQAYGYIEKTNDLRHAGHYDDAIKVSQKAIDIYPYDASFHLGLGLAYDGRGKVRTVKGDLREAAADFNLSETELLNALDLYKRDWHVWAALGNTLNDLKKYKECEDVLNFAIHNTSPLPPEEDKKQIERNIFNLEQELQKQNSNK